MGKLIGSFAYTHRECDDPKIKLERIFFPASHPHSASAGKSLFYRWHFVANLCILCGQIVCLVFNGSTLINEQYTFHKHSIHQRRLCVAFNLLANDDSDVCSHCVRLTTLAKLQVSCGHSAIPKVQRQLIEKKTRDLFTKLNDFEDKSKRPILVRFCHSTCAYLLDSFSLTANCISTSSKWPVRFFPRFRVLGSHFEFAFSPVPEQTYTEINARCTANKREH